jgi:hypothetical protein
MIAESIYKPTKSRQNKHLTHYSYCSNKMHDELNSSRKNTAWFTSETNGGAQGDTKETAVSRNKEIMLRTLDRI